MQHHGQFPSVLRFQYPLRVEVGCNGVFMPHFHLILHVSVPSTGRSGLQRCGKARAKRFLRSFSTLYGSKWVATHVRSFDRVTCVGFSTLYGSKWVATAINPNSASSGKRFSTLYGSKWVATLKAAYWSIVNLVVSVPSTGRSGLQRWHDNHYPARCRFQYPLRVEVGCNFVSVSQARIWRKVSVPSTGRSGLQRRRAGHACVRSVRFSTLYGSKWVATS